MFNSKDALFHYTNVNVYEYVFNKYLNNIDYREYKQCNKRVYDNLGLIDTLGYNSDRGINHFSYSDEGCSLFAIKQTNLWFVCCNSDLKEVYIFEGNYFKNKN